jgi:hypothetical protein
LLAHRGAREHKLLQVLGRGTGNGTGGGDGAAPLSIDELLPSVYDDVPAHMHPVAARSLQAHLLKLVQDGAVLALDDGRWQRRATSR